ncbi:hypothetical protein E4K67_28160 [Desulfosporosinus fructosivorans]|uniref:Uncharacterized protein n=1 Tax=Desulfosporosinus fructosivorans TaxID=2018669 RepID=A0A4Z0QWM5_9FIRM|nr:hypothetical protein E4K67_28160 [Desulfosporosinus fructosivorans]
MAFLNKTALTPLLLTYDNVSMYLHIDHQECALFGVESSEPFYRIHEPLLLAHGIMTDAKTVHLVVLKTSGELCYTLISGSSTPQTTLIAQLDVRTTKYRRLFLFPQGKIIHIFYASTHQAIPDVWHIEHRLWNGNSWLSTRMGEVVHPREPLYHVNLDSQGNLHFLTVTFQGRHSLLFTNRFNGTFNIWGSPAETLKIPGEIVDIAALMTSDNIHHLYWIVKTPNGQFELRSAQQSDAHELSSTWHPAPAPIKTFNTPCKNIGALELNGVLWLLARTVEEVLMINNGNGWRLISSKPVLHQPLLWVHKARRNFHQTYWLEDQAERRAPAFYRELGFTLKDKVTPVPTPVQTTQPILAQDIPPVPAFYPGQIPSDLPSLASVTLNEVESSTPSPIEVNVIPEVIEAPATTNIPDNSSEDVLPSLPMKENAELERLITTVAQLEQENTKLSDVLQSMLSKFDQILGAISDNVSQPKQPRKSKQKTSHYEEFEHPQTVFETSFEEPDAVKEAMANLEKETEGLSQVLRVMMAKQEQSDSSLENLGLQISQLQEDKEVKNKGGFWNKWIT